MQEFAHGQFGQPLGTFSMGSGLLNWAFRLVISSLPSMIYANQVSYLFFYLKKQVLLQRKSNAPIFEAPRPMYMSIVVCLNEILIADRVDANDVIISKLSIYCITSKLPFFHSFFQEYYLNLIGYLDPILHTY